MATGYQKVSIYEDGETVSASLFNSDFNALTNAFNASTGHDHDGTTGGGAPISKIGDADFNNKIEIDGTNNLIKLFIEVGGNTATEILNVSENALFPVASSIGLGTVSNPFDTGNITTLTSTSLNSTNLTVDTDTLYVDSTNHRVGINTTAPDESLHVVDGSFKISNSSTYPEIILSKTGSNPNETKIYNSFGSINFFDLTNSRTLLSIGANTTHVGSTSALGGSAKLKIITQSDGAYSTTNMLSSALSGTPRKEVSLMMTNFAETDDTIVKSVIGFGVTNGINVQFSERAAMGAVYSNDNITDTGLVFGTKTTGDTNVKERMRIDSTGKLGINTTTPKSLLDIVSDGESIITLSSTDSSASQNELIGGIHFYNRDGYSTGPNNAVKITAVTSTADGEDGELIFSTKPGATQGDDALESVRIDSSGNVGINNNNPQEVLDVVGNIKTTGSIYGTGNEFKIQNIEQGANSSNSIILEGYSSRQAVKMNSLPYRTTEDTEKFVLDNERFVVYNIDYGFIEHGLLVSAYDGSSNNVGAVANVNDDEYLSVIHADAKNVKGYTLHGSSSNSTHGARVKLRYDGTSAENVILGSIDFQADTSSFATGFLSQIQSKVTNASSQTAELKLDSDTVRISGRLGVNTSPSTLFHAADSGIVPTATIESTNASGTPTLKLKGSEASEIKYVDENDTPQTTLKLEDDGVFKVLKSDSTENFKVSTTGQITAKSASLNSRMLFNSSDASGNSRIFFTADTTAETGSAQAQSGFYFAEKGVGFNDAASIVYTAHDEHIRFANKGGGQVMSIKESKVGILTTTPQEDLHVAGTIQSEKLVGRTVNNLFVIENKDTNGDVVNGIKLDSDGNFKIREGSSDSAYIIESTDDNFNIQRNNVLIDPSSGNASLTLHTGANVRSSIYFDALPAADTGTAANISYYGVNDKFVIYDGSENALTMVGGKVGVMQQSPNEALDVTGNIKATGTLQLGDITLPNTDGTSGQALVTDGSGAVSFGTVGTPTDVVVDGDFSSAGLMQTDGSGTYSVQAIDGTNGQVLSTDGSGGLSWVDAGASDAITDGDFTSGGIMTTDGNGVYSVVAGSTTEGHVMQVNATNGVEFSHFDKLYANLDIGAFNLTTSDINGDGRTRLGAGTAAAPAYSFQNDNDTGLYLSNTNSISIATGGTEAVRVRSAALECSSGSNTAPGIAFKDAANTGIFNPQSTILGIATNGSTRITVNASGFVGVGTTYAPQRLTVAGTVQSSGFRATTSGSSIDNAGYYGSAGLNIKSASSGSGYQLMINFQDSGATDRGSIKTNNTSTQYNTTSDQRLKENIQDATDAGSKIDAIQIRQFDWIGSDVHQDYGVVAQELIDVAPEAVSTSDNEEDMMGVDYSKLVPMLIKEIQSLRSRVAELENN